MLEWFEKFKGLGDPTVLANELPANYCGSCYGAPNTHGQCCNTCNDVREAYRKAGWGFTNPDSIEQVHSSLE
jgi:7-cyano-7-deazaguanine synthase in queuosine biosynthesis